MILKRNSAITRDLFQPRFTPNVHVRAQSINVLSRLYDHLPQFAAPARLSFIIIFTTITIFTGIVKRVADLLRGEAVAAITNLRGQRDKHQSHFCTIRQGLQPVKRVAENYEKLIFL